MMLCLLSTKKAQSPIRGALDWTAELWGMMAIAQRVVYHYVFEQQRPRVFPMGMCVSVVILGALPFVLFNDFALFNVPYTTMGYVRELLFVMAHHYNGSLLALCG